MTHICTCGDCQRGPYDDVCKFQVAVADLAHRLCLVIDAANSSDAVLFNMVKQVQNDTDYPLEYLKVLAGDRG